MAAALSKTIVLVTGGSGFLGAHCISALLRDGYQVRTTLRSLSKADSVRSMLSNDNIPLSLLSNLSFAPANLTEDKGWAEAVSGATYVLHVASPVPPNNPKNEDELIVPAREGTLRVLRAAKASSSVKRVVVTSSFGAVGYGHPDTKPFTEDDWTDLKVEKRTYMKAKTIAERAAWEFVQNEGGDAGLELSVVCPTRILGPVLGKDVPTSVFTVQRMLSGDMPGCPQLAFSLVDVRDCARLHVLAMTHEKAAGQKFLAVAPPAISMYEIAVVLKEKLPAEKTGKVSTRVLPNALLRLMAWFNPEVALVVPDLGMRREVSGDKAHRVLGWKTRGRDETVVDTAEALFRFGLVKE